MILDITLQKDSKGLPVNAKSTYLPGVNEKARLFEILQHFQISRELMNKPYKEFNDKSLIERQSEDQAHFNSYVPAKSKDPDKFWRSNAVRPIVRNRVISVAAHITGNLIFPQVFAQNNQDEEDKDAATIMRDLMEWVAEQSDYAKTFLYSIFAALVNPAAIVYTEYADVKRTVKQIKEDGSWTEKSITDEQFSGFRDYIVPVDELYISDIYEHDIQKQQWLIWRRVVDFNVVQGRYGKNDNFKKYVKPGLQIFYDDASSTFYEQYEENLRQRLVEEIIYWRRSDDLKLCVVNGVLVTDIDQPNPRQDKKYPFVKFGAELIDEGKFFYYKSLVSKLSKDADIVNTLYRMIIDGTYLQIMPSLAVFGDEQINSSVMVPASIHVFNQDTKIEPLNINNNLLAGFNAIEKVERSISESSQDLRQSGQESKGAQTAFEISRLEQNARIMLGLLARMVGFAVKELGDLKISDILQYLTVGQVADITSEGGRLKFPTFILPEKTIRSKTRTRRIEFTTEFDQERTPLERSFDIYKEEEKKDVEIMRANPTLFRKIKFLTKISPDVVTPPSDQVQKALMLEEYDRAVNNPIIDQETVTRELLLGAYDKTKNDPDKYITKQPLMPPPGVGPEGSPLSKILGAGSAPKQLAASV